MLTNATAIHVLRTAFATIPLEDTGVLAEQEKNLPTKVIHATLTSAL